MASEDCRHIMSERIRDSAALQQNLRESAIYDQHVQCLLGKYIIKKATPEQDMQLNTDFQVDSISLSIMSRVRGSECFPDWGMDFIFRAYADGGNQSEYDKMLDGMGQWYFYGFGHPTRPNVVLWYWLFDLDAIRYGINNGVTGTIMPNRHNPRDIFIVYNINHFPRDPDIVIGGNIKLQRTLL